MGGTVAFLATRTDEVENTFVPAAVSCKVNETLSGNQKSNVTIQNTGNIKAYIRAAVIVNWVKADGSVCGAVHEAATNVFTPGTGWEYDQSTGFYYYTQPVDPGASTGNLIPSATLATSSVDGCTMQIEIVASAIQAEGLSNSYQTAWSTAANARPSGN